jgi:hypothetical protein
MIVLCGNALCGAVLRVSTDDTHTTAVLLRDDMGEYFFCPRCFRRTSIPGVPADLRKGEGPRWAPRRFRLRPTRPLH